MDGTACFSAAATCVTSLLLQLGFSQANGSWFSLTEPFKFTSGHLIQIEFSRVSSSQLSLNPGEKISGNLNLEVSMITMGENQLYN